MDESTIEWSLREYFRSHPSGIAAAYLFGSVARGESTERSDVDLGVLYAEDPEATMQGLGLRLEGDLERLLRRPVQLVVLNRAAVDLVHRVLRDGKLLFEGDRSRRIRFEVSARNHYFDLQPILRRYRRLEKGSR